MKMQNDSKTSKQSLYGTTKEDILASPLQSYESN